jgi:hypothetical protein
MAAYATSPAPSALGNRALQVAKCSLCGLERPVGLMVPDGGEACTDLRWYCKDAKSCTQRWTSRLRESEAESAPAPEPTASKAVAPKPAAPKASAPKAAAPKAATPKAAAPKAGTSKAAAAKSAEPAGAKSESKSQSESAEISACP